MSEQKILVVQVAALGWELVQRHKLELPGLTFQPTRSIFPALTCPVQGTMRTARPPEEHGMLCNGTYDRRLRKVLFWEQSAAQVEGSRIWDSFRANGGRTGMFFWQQSLGETVDWVLSPAPIHRHHGGMIQDCVGRPETLYPRLRKALKRPFNLMRYWGPLASPASSQWIAEATANLMTGSAAPRLLFTYLPALDYDLQRYGPSNPRCQRACQRAMDQLALLAGAARENGYELVIYGDYAMTDCPGGPVYPNRILRQAGLLTVRPVKHMTYLDLFHTPAFAMVDHEIAHVYTTSDDIRVAATAALETVEGIAEVRKGPHGPHGPDLLLVAEQGHWFSYCWWETAREAPDYASHVDIHNKPGFDPCELFFGWPPGTVSGNDRRIGGTHGRVEPGREVAWASTCLKTNPDNLLALSRNLGQWLDAAS